MAAANATGEWHQLGERNYRKWEVYQLDWGVDLSKHKVAAAEFGGAIAITRDSEKIIAASGTRQGVQILSAAGRPLGSFKVSLHLHPHTSQSDAKARLITMGWTNTERLMCVMSDGTVQQYDIRGTWLNQFSLGLGSDEVGVVDAQVWGTGLVCLLGNLQLLALTDLEMPRPQMLADPCLAEHPTAWAVIQPQFTGDNNVEVLLATRGGSIVTVDAVRRQDQGLTNGPFVRLSVSPDGKILACFTSDGKLWVVSTDFARNLSEFNTRSGVPPIQLEWCGTDSIVMYWDQILLMVGPFGDWVKFAYDEPIVLVGECDGVRIITNSVVEFLQRVPAVTEDIFRIGSTHPAALLHDAMELFDKHNPKADENIRSIRADLPDAVEACIEAAGHEWHYTSQRPLLKAASFGKCFLEGHSPDSFVSMSRTLRVLAAVRHYKVGLPITVRQYERLSAEVLVGRLVNRHHHLLALRVCEFLSMKVHGVLVHWACCKVKTRDDDDVVLNAIVDKLKDTPGISYADIAATAYDERRRDLATRLLDYEPRAADQVPLLIRMQQDQLALIKAIESGDTDLVYLVLQRLKTKLSPPEFFRLVHGKPAAENLLLVFCRDADREMLKDFYYQADRAHESAAIAVMDALREPKLDDRSRQLQIAQRLFADYKDQQFAAKTVEDMAKLLAMQREMDDAKSTREPTAGRPLVDTVYECILRGDLNGAQKLRTSFKMPDKHFWWTKVRALGAVSDWDGLFKFSKERKSPIGYRPFFDVCHEKLAFREAGRYISRLSDTLEMVECYQKVNMWVEAVECALKSKNGDLIKEVRLNAGERATHDQQVMIERAITQSQRG